MFDMKAILDIVHTDDVIKPINLDTNKQQGVITSPCVCDKHNYRREREESMFLP